MDNLSQVFSQFHFIRPWLLLLVPAAFIVWLLLRQVSASSQWQEHLPDAVVNALQVSKSKRAQLSHWCWLVAWLLIGFAAAGPSWLKQAVPVVQNQSATVVILDLSQSMLAQDLTPNRLTLAKYKLIDVLRQQPSKSAEPTPDGQVALIAYSGDAYTVSPLTDDPNTIEALLPALHPNVMPSVGSNVEAAIVLAKQLFSDAGIAAGHILLLSDGVPMAAFEKIEQELSGLHRLSILGVGSNEAAPVPLQGGGFLRSNTGEIVLASLNASQLRSLAEGLGGRFAQISTNENDLDLLLNTDFTAGEGADVNAEKENSFDAWTDMGHWLLLALIPIFLIFFRKGLVYCVPLLCTGLLLSPTDSYAASLWEKLWKNPDQRGAELLEQQNYEAAVDEFDSKKWSAHAAYKNADYAKALQQLENQNDTQSLYNKGNAHALNGDIDAAIESYKKVLEQQQDHADAKHNLDLLEQLKEQQEQQQDQQQQDQQSSDEQQGSDQDPDEDQSQHSGDSEQQQSESQNSDSQTNDAESNQEEQQKGSDESNSEEENSENERSENKNSENESSEENPSEQSEEQSEEQAQPESETDAESQQQRNLVESPEPLKDSSEQWLRTIQDDPSGLLRRKFDDQSRERRAQGQRSREQKDDSGSQRY